MRNPYRLAGVLLALALLAAACGGDDGGSASGDGEGGAVVISGSSTVAPISTRVAELVADEGSAIEVSVDGPGTGDGFALFCEGDTDISDASRPIQPEEAQTCEENGIEYIELKVAIDGLSVLTNPANESVACLTFEDLYALAGPESEGLENWSEAQELAAELGSDTEFPDAPFVMVAPGEESGTYDSFIEIALADIAEARAEEGAITEEQADTTRADYQSSGDDNIIIQGIEGADTSFGWVGYAFAAEAGDGVKVVEVDGGDGCVAPTPETIADGSYPIARPLYIYVDAAKADENPAIAEYVDFYLGDGITAVEEVGYVPLTDDEISATREVWETRETGTRDGGE